MSIVDLQTWIHTIIIVHECTVYTYSNEVMLFVSFKEVVDKYKGLFANKQIYMYIMFPMHSVHVQ